MTKNYFLLVSEENITISLFESLQNNQHELLIARSEEEAVELLIEYENFIDIVFIENIIFNRHGINILKKLREISYVPEYIIITESRNLETVTNCMISGASDCISKPLNSRTLKHKIELAIETNSLDKKVLQEIEKQNIQMDEAQMNDILYQDLLMKSRIIDEVLPLDVSHDFLEIAHEREQKLSQSVKQAILADIETSIKNYKANVLVIDDEIDWQDSLSMLLEDYAHNVYVAGNAKEGLRIAQEIEDLDLVLLDIRMPGDMHGTDLLPILLEKVPSCKVIMVTAFNDMETAIDTINKGAFDYVNKPYTPEEVLAKLTRAIRVKHYPKLLKNSLVKLKEQTLNIERRKAMLEQLCEERKLKGKPIRMEEVYVFFRECKQKETAISGSTTLSPDMILKEGVDIFVDRLLGKRQF